MERLLTILLAGGAGERLAPLTLEEPKPMMPFGGIYRLIDVTLSNCVNSGLTEIFVLTQHKALSLNRHIREAWHILSPELGQFIEAVPPTRRLSDTWYLGTADAVYQNIQSIEEEGAPYTLVLSADHIYKMNYRHMLDWHIERSADVTVGTTQVSPDEAPRFGIVDMDDSFCIYAFEEKPQHGQPQRSHFNPDACSASMGVYLFATEVLLEALREDAEDPESTHDFGRDVLPGLMGRRRVVAYDFIDENRKEVRYWRDVGTLDAYYEANMDLVAVTPVFNLYDPDWPIRTAPPSFRPPSLSSPTRAGERAWRSILWFPTGASSPEAVWFTASCQPVYGLTASAWWKDRCCSPMWSSAGTARSGRRSLTRTFGCPSPPRSGWIPKPTFGPGFLSPTPG